jgi:hypothetical protein
MNCEPGIVSPVFLNGLLDKIGKEHLLMNSINLWDSKEVIERESSIL